MKRLILIMLVLCSGLVYAGNVQMGNDGSIVAEDMGVKLNWNSSSGSFAVGHNPIASGDFSTALGFGTQARYFSSIAIGYLTTASNYYSTAMGYETVASGRSSTAMGYETVASGRSSTAMGYDTIASADYSTAMGSGTTASGHSSTSMGWNTTASGHSSTSMGYDTAAIGDYSTALGIGTVAESYGSLAIGTYGGILGGSKSSWDAGDIVFAIGNGQSESSMDNAAAFLRNGNVIIAGSLIQNSDKKLKDNIKSIDKSLEKISQLEGISFKWKPAKNRDKKNHIGLIAQDVEEVFPELVGEDMSGYKSLDYQGLIAPLIESVKELKEKNENLMGEVELLKDELCQKEDYSWCKVEE